MSLLLLSDLILKPPWFASVVHSAVINTLIFHVQVAWIMFYFLRNCNVISAFLFLWQVINIRPSTLMCWRLKFVVFPSECSCHSRTEQFVALCGTVWPQCLVFRSVMVKWFTWLKSSNSYILWSSSSNLLLLIVAFSTWIMRSWVYTLLFLSNTFFFLIIVSPALLLSNCFWWGDSGQSRCSHSLQENFSALLRAALGMLIPSFRNKTVT